jgi:uncharacterized membrane protein
MSRSVDAPAVVPAQAHSRVPVWAVVASLVLTVLGLGMALYLSYEHATGSTSLVCSDTGTINCLKVTTSSFSVIAGIPVAYLGLAYFVVGLFVMLPALWRRGGVFSIVRLGYTTVGLLMVLYLVYVELFKLQTICLWCTGVHIATFLLFAVTLLAEALREPEYADA